jgi:hypothetical protein
MLYYQNTSADKRQEPNPKCSVGANIEVVLQLILRRAQDAMEQILADITMKELVTELAQQIDKILTENVVYLTFTR